MIFFRGGQYQVYRYRKYDDVRLVFDQCDALSPGAVHALL